MSNGLINRQYVGARYVPKIMGEWNKALQYEALSVVTYMGNSFTSKVPVPANVEINNEDYWINTGNYNAQVEEYKQLVNNEILRKPYVSIEDYGAIANTDITAALNMAIEECNKTGKNLYIPSKNYIVSDPITINKSICIFGDIGRGATTGDYRSVDFSLIYTGNNTLFTISEQCSYVVIDALSIKGNSNSICFEVNTLRNKFMNCYIAYFDKVFSLTMTNSEIPAFENIIDNNYFYENNIVLYSYYKRGSATDGYFTNNIIIKGNYSINSTVLSQWIISGNHDYTNNGINISQGVNLQINNNYFDNGNKTSINILANGGLQINSNQFLCVETTADIPNSKINISTNITEYDYSFITVTGNLLTITKDSGGKIHLLNCNLPCKVTGNIVFKNGIEVTSSTKNHIVNDISDIETLTVTKGDKITLNTYTCFKANNIIQLNFRFTTTEKITNYTDIILKTNFNLKYDKLLFTATNLNTKENYLLTIVNNGDALMSANDIPSDQTIVGTVILLAN